MRKFLLSWCFWKLSTIPCFTLLACTVHYWEILLYTADKKTSKVLKHTYFLNEFLPAYNKYNFFLTVKRISSPHLHASFGIVCVQIDQLKRNAVRLRTLKKIRNRQYFPSKKMAVCRFPSLLQRLTVLHITVNYTFTNPSFLFYSECQTKSSTTRKGEHWFLTASYVVRAVLNISNIQQLWNHFFKCLIEADVDLGMVLRGGRVIERVLLKLKVSYFIVMNKGKGVILCLYTGWTANLWTILKVQGY